MKNLLYLLMILPFAVKAQLCEHGQPPGICNNDLSEHKGVSVYYKSGTGISTGLQANSGNPNTYVGVLAGTIPTDSVSVVIGCCATKPEWKADTVKVVMLVSDTSTVGEVTAGFEKRIIKMQDTRPFMMYGFQTPTGELLDAYKQKLSKNYVMWIAYKTK